MLRSANSFEGVFIYALGLLEFWQQWRWRRRPISRSLYKPHLALLIYGSLPGVFSLSVSPSSTLPTAFRPRKDCLEGLYTLVLYTDCPLLQFLFARRPALVHRYRLVSNWRQLSQEAVCAREVVLRAAELAAARSLHC